ncbi:tRNA pseudouridine(55) synthase TruB [Cellulomonas dongxiuzhuiae]|uniref:tRNA pseudouridine(55) synthase TruB n=1 Tax=Cellulomonas dongxiuzhuiae TaxID=2819979 RepID=UPI001AAF92E7|nr:tRNA pseudouridine(55) synthase TruB [Cellulomonas dongxiuzhuiae]MBO3087526.1 tRNA pseudouridine(55) synthase TruB [Cellulomonas dongxiuzhuiae]
MTAARGERGRAPAGPRRPTADDGVLVVDKPAGWTSHDVVARVRRLASTRKVGHAGTLDPMATGVLVIGVGRATRLLTYVTGADKDYAATVRLGVTTTTDDAEGEVVARADAAHVTRADLDVQVAALTGDLLQVPSSVSAIKVDGRRAYALVRAGEEVELAARPVHVARFAVRDVRAAQDDGAAVLDVDVEVTCSSGTYVRALARDLGTVLGVGGHLTALRRTRVGGFGLEQARTLDELAATPEDVAVTVLPLADAARAVLPARELTEAEARALSYGQGVDPADEHAGPIAALAPDGTLVAIVERRGPHMRPTVVFAPA